MVPSLHFVLSRSGEWARLERDKDQRFEKDDECHGSVLVGGIVGDDGFGSAAECDLDLGG